MRVELLIDSDNGPSIEVPTLNLKPNKALAAKSQLLTPKSFTWSHSKHARTVRILGCQTLIPPPSSLPTYKQNLTHLQKHLAIYPLLIVRLL